MQSFAALDVMHADVNRVNYFSIGSFWLEDSNCNHARFVVIVMCLSSTIDAPVFLLGS